MGPRLPSVLYEMMALSGGLDQITPTLSLPPGIVKDGVNFECSPTGGYSRIVGYERFDGRPSPHLAAYQIIQIGTFVNVPAVGQVITNGGGTATGTIIAVTSTYLAVTEVSGVFANGDTIKVGATVIGMSQMLNTMVSSKTDAQYTALAANVRRALIQPVPGSGPIRGVACFQDVVYAFRDNAGGTATELWKSTTGGWSKIAFLYEVSFTAGTTQPADGAILTKGAVTATVRRVVTQSGAWSGTAAGRFIITAPAGGNFSAGAATLSGGSTVTLSGVQTAITLAPGGKFEFYQGNFSGQLSTMRLYWTDGVNRCCEFDGTTVVPITTGITPDQPKHLAVHKNHLIVSVQSSIFYSGIGNPYNWTTLAGAGEIAIGDTCTGFLPQPGSQNGGAMAVFGRSNTFILYGNSASDWNLVPFNTGTGALDYTAQNMAQSYVLDDRGVVGLTTSLNYGNFDQASLTNQIKPFIMDKRSKVAYSSLLREKSQYRLFFNDGYGLYITVVNNKFMGAMPVYFPDIVYCAAEGELSNGNEVTYFGSASGGYVFQMDVGTSFDGRAIDAYITLNWASIKSPRILKRFRRCSAEIAGNYYAEVNFGYQLGYGSTDIIQPTPVTYASPFAGVPRWDSFTWDNFVWDGRTLMPTECEMVGTGENVQVTLSSSSDYIASYTINSLILHYTLRRGLR